MHVVLQLSEGWLAVQAEAAGIDERRPLSADEMARFSNWTTQ
jgi:hypothetical protein